MKKLKHILTAKPGSTKENKTGGWGVHKPVIDQETCIGCGTCNTFCPEGICFSTGLKNKKGLIFYSCDLDYCKGCGLCAKECPVKAIKMVDAFK
jgi:pyruvate ferredoxin oxidoreductase delta subunit